MGRRKLAALETFRDEIARALHSVKSYDLPTACVRFGLAAGTEDEAFRSKFKYVRVRLVNLDDKELLALSRKVLKEYEAPSLEDFVGEFSAPSEHRVSDLTRREILKELENVDVLFGDVSVWDGLGTLTPNWSESSKYQNRWDATIRDDIEKHYLHDPDLNHREALELCGAMVCAQRRFFDLLEKLAHPTCRRGDSQAQLVSALNKLLVADGYELVIAGSISRHAYYEVKRVARGVAGTPKNLIFAAVRTKPDLYFTDAINNDVAILDCNVYDKLDAFPDSLALLTRLIGLGRVSILATPSLWREIEDSPYRRLAESLRVVHVGESVALIGGHIGDRVGAGRLFHAHLGKSKQMRNDALIADAADHDAEILVSEDREMRKRAKKNATRCMVATFAEFIALLEHLQRRAARGGCL